jgi:hypothetical protein
MSTTKKKAAVFTIVKNESYFLPKWIKHYQQYFDKADIYVLDHQSNDGSTEDLSVNVVPVINELAFDHQWLVETVQNFQIKLFESYEVVIFAESDELLYTLDKPLNEMIDDFISDQGQQLVTCVGYEVKQDLDNEATIMYTDKIFKYRDYWYRSAFHYDKTLISKIPLNWVWGFHDTIGHAKNYAYSLHMVHLHRCDFELMLERHAERAKKWNIKNDGDGVGFQHRLGERDQVLSYFNQIPAPVERIPDSHKTILINI